MASTPLIALLVIGLGLAFILGTLAHRLKISPLVGYLLAGVAVGPFTPGFVADQHLAHELSEIGIVLLMFGVGLHFSLSDLMAVRWTVLPGALLQSIASTALGFGIASLFGWDTGASLVFGLTLSVGSTVVLTRALGDRRLMDSPQGRLAVGWLVTQDLFTIIALVMLPVLAPLLDGAAAGRPASSDFWQVIALTLGKIAAFVVLMLVVGRRAIPAILHYVAHTGSRELFRLAVLSVALGVAFGAAELFDVSFALGAFFAGMVLAESQLSQRAANEILPLRDAFAVLFFVSVGMLVNPATLLHTAWLLPAALFVVLIGTPLVTYGLLRLFRQSRLTGLLLAGGLAQIGEFSFVLVALGVGLKLVPPEAQDAVMAASILSILVNPLLMAGWDRLRKRHEQAVAASASDIVVEDEPALPPALPPMTSLTGHLVLIGHGRVGRVVTAEIAAPAQTLVIEENAELLGALSERGFATLAGNAARHEYLQAANLAAARVLLVAIPEAFEAGQIVQQARAINPHLLVIARAHSDAEVDYLRGLGADHVIMGENEIAHAMLHIARTAIDAPRAATATPCG